MAWAMGSFEQRVMAGNLQMPKTSSPKMALSTSYLAKDVHVLSSNFCLPNFISIGRL